MLELSRITHSQNLAFLALLVFKLLSRQDVYEQKREWKMLRRKLTFKNISISRVYNYNFANTNCNILNPLNVKFTGYTSIT